MYLSRHPGGGGDGLLDHFFDDLPQPLREYPACAGPKPPRCGPEQACRRYSTVTGPAVGTKVRENPPCAPRLAPGHGMAKDGHATIRSQRRQAEHHPRSPAPTCSPSFCSQLPGLYPPPGRCPGTARDGSETAQVSPSKRRPGCIRFAHCVLVDQGGCPHSTRCSPVTRPAWW